MLKPPSLSCDRHYDPCDDYTDAALCLAYPLDSGCVLN
jgi:hypothetical protein